MREAIHYYSLLYSGDWSKIAKAISDDEPYQRVEDAYFYVTIVDKEYPEKLKQLHFPPWILYYEGNLNLLKQATLGIVGSREASSYGRLMTEQVCKANVDKVIISGLAKGIDTIAHQNAAKTIGVIACGLNIYYPSCNARLYENIKRDHLLVSEYPKDVRPLKHHFPWRNRIIAALSDSIVVTQAKIQSGTLITVNHAIELSKEVYAVPYALNQKEGEGCNQIIYNGVNMLLNSEESI